MVDINLMIGIEDDFRAVLFSELIIKKISFLGGRGTVARSFEFGKGFN